jgi:hypothetical protein
MEKYTINAIGNFMNICSKCKTCDNYDEYCPYIVMMTPEYLFSFLKLNPLRVQMMSFFNILILLKD